MNIAASAASVPVIWIALRVTFLRRRIHADHTLSANEKIMVYPGDVLVSARHHQAGDYVRLIDAATGDGPVEGEWFVVADKWHAEPAVSLDQVKIPAAQRDLMYDFLSLGEDCEFSFIQRRAGAEPIEMLRFAGTAIKQLIAGFDEAFAAVGEPEHMRFDVFPNKEMWCVNRKYGFKQHIFKNPDELDMPAFEKEQTVRLRFLRRKFLEDLKAGNKILIYKNRLGAALDDVLKLNAAIRKWGNSPLLWVVKSNDGQVPWVINSLGDGLYKTHISKFAPDGKAALGALDEWMTICSNAKALIQAG